MSNRDIEEHLNNLYGIDVSPLMISKITDKIIPEIREWQSRQLDDVYPIVFMDAIHYSVRKEGIVVKKAVYGSNSNWNELTTYFKYDTKIRKLIYTTNPIESLNRQLRKYTKTKSLYPIDEALMKSVYLSLKEATKKWTGRISGQGEIYSQLSIYFEGRI